MTPSVAPEVLENLLDAARECYGTKVEVSSIDELAPDNPDRVIDKDWRDRQFPYMSHLPYTQPTITYTHTVTVRYWCQEHKCNYLATYGITDEPAFHLWAD